MRTLLLAASLFSVAAFFSCTPSSTTEFETTMAFTLEGPLFEGPNSGQSSIAEAYTEWLSANGLTKDDVKQVALREVTLVGTDPVEPGFVTDAGLTFAGGDLEMTQVAVLNPVPASAEGAQLKTSEEANIAPFFGLNDFIVLLDLGLASDWDDNLNATVKMKFEVTYKSKES